MGIMATTKAQDVTIQANTDDEITITLTNVPSLVGASGIWSVFERDGVGPVIIKTTSGGGLVLTDPDTATITLVPADTIGLEGVWSHKLEISAVGDIVPTKGAITIE